MQLCMCPSWVYSNESRESEEVCQLRHRCLAGLLTVMGVALLAPVPATGQAQTAAADRPTPPRTPWGASELQGVWDFRTVTPFERPKEFAGKELLTAEEAADFEQRDADVRSKPNRETPEDECPDDVPICSEGPLAYEFRIRFDRGATVVGTRRTSLILDPPEGKMRSLTPAAEEKRTAVREARGGFGFHEPTSGGAVEDLGRGG